MGQLKNLNLLNKTVLFIFQLLSELKCSQKRAENGLKTDRPRGKNASKPWFLNEKPVLKCRKKISDCNGKGVHSVFGRPDNRGTGEPRNWPTGKPENWRTGGANGSASSSGIRFSFSPVFQSFDLFRTVLWKLTGDGRLMSLRTRIVLRVLSIGAALWLCACRPAAQQPAPTPADHSPAVVETPAVENRLVRVPGGEFLMGCEEYKTNCQEYPPRRVRVAPFAVDEHEVTAAEYAQCVERAQCKAPAVDRTSAVAFAANYGRADRGDHPVNHVNHEQAVAYCRALGKRLPTEAEFEWLLRQGGKPRVYPWGDEPQPPPGYGNYADERARDTGLPLPIIAGYDDGFRETAPVCRFPRDAFGLCDLSGNVWEWCAADGDARFVRGGSWHNDATMLHAAARYRLASDGYVHVGFRCAADDRARSPK
jgi:formylglycine-generating enzyme required for sulfatase activity